MPPSLPKGKLSGMTPSAEELAAARKSYQALNERELNSKRASLRAYLKNNGETLAKEDTVAMVEKFMVIQARAKESQKTRNRED